MPRPAYIVFAQMGVVDQATNGISFFNVIEGVDGVAMEPTATPPADAGMVAHLTAVWLKEPSDTPDVYFESDVICLSPSGTPIFLGVTPPFSFAANVNFHRLTLREFRIAGFPEIGTYVIEARLRRADQSDWVARQTFPFVVSERANKQPPAADAAPSGP
jgi:hypothetical protein